MIELAIVITVLNAGLCLVNILVIREARRIMAEAQQLREQNARALMRLRG